MGVCGKLWRILGEGTYLSAFKGTYYYSIDHKGRISLPVKLRDKSDSPTGDSYVIAPGFDGCLYIYPHETWKQIELNMKSLKVSDPRARTFERTLFPNSEDAKLDGMGRLTIPRLLLELAKIKKEVVILGVNEKIELWDPDVLRVYRESQTESYEDVARQLLI